MRGNSFSLSQSPSSYSLYTPPLYSICVFPTKLYVCSFLSLISVSFLLRSIIFLLSLSLSLPLLSVSFTLYFFNSFLFLSLLFHSVQVPIILWLLYLILSFYYSSCMPVFYLLSLSLCQSLYLFLSECPVLSISLSHFILSYSNYLHVFPLSLSLSKSLSPFLPHLFFSLSLWDCVSSSFISLFHSLLLLLFQCLYSPIPLPISLSLCR